MQIYKTLAKSFPELRQNLIRAGIGLTPEAYIKKTLLSSLYLSLALNLVLFLFSKSILLFLFFPIIFLIVFLYLSKNVFQRIKTIDAEVSKEIVFAGRFLIIELESGIPLYNTFENIARNYTYVGRYFGMIVDKIRLGISIDEAITETIDVCPSENMRRILWQILNSIKTGADISKSLSNVIENIVREQNISVKEFSHKLTPLSMFYMMAAIIVPSLGVTMLIVLASFLQIQLSIWILLMLAATVGFIQLMFLVIIKNSRPSVDM
jgi:flagellar protein FlaJ